MEFSRLAGRASNADRVSVVAAGGLERLAGGAVSARGDDGVGGGLALGNKALLGSKGCTRQTHGLRSGGASLGSVRPGGAGVAGGAFGVCGRGASLQSDLARRTDFARFANGVTASAARMLFESVGRVAALGADPAGGVGNLRAGGLCEAGWRCLARGASLDGVLEHVRDQFDFDSLVGGEHDLKMGRTRKV